MIKKIVLSRPPWPHRRQIYAEKAYSNLYDYLVQEFGYSPSAAQRRIVSARLLREVPEISDKIESGAINMSQLSQMHQAIRSVQSIENRKVTTLEKKQILNKIENLTQPKTEVVLAQELSLPVIDMERVVHHRDESVSVTLHFSKQEIEIIKKAQDIFAHSVPDRKMNKLLVYLVERELSRKRKVSKNPFCDRNHANALKMESVNLESNTEASVSKKRKPINPNLRNQVLKTFGCCQFRDPASGKLCGSQRFLQVDHIHPVWAGGNDCVDNLQVLCAQHNRWKYQKEAGQHPLRM